MSVARLVDDDGEPIHPGRARPRDRAVMRANYTARLDRRVHDLYLFTEASNGDVDDDEFVHLHGLRVECDPECNRLLAVLRRLDMWDPASASYVPQAPRGKVG